jgi:thiamine-phosphate diphosphorylase
MVALPLPALVVLTDGTATDGRSVTEVVAAAVDGGARAVLLREKYLSRGERSFLAAELRALLSPVGGLLLVASDASIPADGLHLAANDPMPPGVSGPLGRSCHSASDVARAAREGCSYATLSPIYLTASKPGYGPALGPGALAGHPIPVWALGGITAANAQACLEAGAAGVAVMGTVMRAADPAATVAAILPAIRRVRV